MCDISSDAKVSTRVIARSIQLRLYRQKCTRSKRFAKHLGHVYFCTRLVRRNFEAYVRAEARQRRKQPALFLLSHCNNNGDVCYFAQTASTLAQGWRRNESCCETVAVAMIHREVFFFTGFLLPARFSSQFPRTRLVSSTAGWWSSFFTYAICTHR